MKILKILLIIAGIVGVALLILFIIKIEKLDIFIGKDSDNGSVISINNIELDRNLSNGGKVKVKAKQATIDNTKENIVLKECTIEYTGKTKVEYIFASADNCIYVEDKLITLQNNLKGSAEDVEIIGTEKTVFTFYLEEGYGEVDNGFIAKNDGNTLKANRLEIYKESRLLDFFDDVEVVYFLK